MATTKLSVHEFQERLRSEIEAIAKSHGWSLDSKSGRGFAFQLWIATLFCNEDRGYETEPEDALLQASDLKADIVLEDTARRHMLIAQCKYESLKKDVAVDESEVNDFFNRHEHYMNSKWVRDHGSEAAADLLGGYRENVDRGYSIDYCFVTTASASERTKNLALHCNTNYQTEKLNIRCRLIDFEALKELYVRSLTLEESPPPEVRLFLPKTRVIELKEPYETIIAVIKGNALRNLYKEHKESLFAWNIRGYLGSRGINEEIRKTAENKPEDFFYFNNGVSAICTGFDVSASNELKANNFQIINGAQTIGALWRVDANPSLEVLFRLTKTAAVKTDKGFNSDIIRYNNSQNVIKVSDFRANDPIQIWLEREFAELKPRGPLPLLRYVRKRSTLNRGSGRALKLEELAKIRYAFLHEPTLCYESPKDLWTPEADDGAYEKAFGVEGRIAEVWTKEEFGRCLIAIAFYLAIEEHSREEKRKDPRQAYLNRMRFHALSLVQLFLKKHLRETQIARLTEDGQAFQNAWSAFWPEARRVLIDGHFDAVERDKGTLHALLRSSDRWSQMKKKFSLYVGVDLEKHSS